MNILINFMNKFFFFDLDGTLKLRNQNIPESLISCVSGLIEAQHVCTIVTGKSFHWLKTCIGDDLHKVLSPDVFIGLENGAKAVNLSGKILYAQRFLEDELSAICDFLEENKKGISLLSFSPAESLGRGVMYIFDERIKNDVERKYKESYDFFDGNIIDFIDHFIMENPGMLNVKISEMNGAERKLSDLEVSINEGYLNLNPKGINKGTFVKRLLEFYDKNMSDSVVVGNDDNDFPMFALPVYKKIFVKNESDISLLPFSDLVFAKDPEDLGRVIGEMGG